MEDILKQLYHGEIAPDEQIDISGEDFKRTAAAYNKAAEKFCKSLNEEQKQEFEQLKYIKNNNDCEYDLLNFKRGFQLGMQLTLAGLQIPSTKPGK